MVEIDGLGLGAVLVAFAAGFVGFISPCVLPLVPGYLSFLGSSSVGTGTVNESMDRRRVVLATTLFVAGFTAMFILLGAGVAWFGGALLENRRPLEIVSGVFLILAGVIFAGVRLPLTAYREWRIHVPRSASLATPPLAGAAFAIGWSPCLGPTLAAILTLSADSGKPTEGAVLLGVYSLGLGIPFILFGIWFTRALRMTAALRRHAKGIGIASGVLLIGFGILLATGQLARITGQLARFTGFAL